MADAAPHLIAPGVCRYADALRDLDESLLLFDHGGPFASRPARAVAHTRERA